MNKHHTPGNRRHCRRNYDIRLMLLFFLLAGVPFAAQAHRGAVDEIDACNIRVGLERVHFTAYTPALSGNREYCKTIPQLGQTHLVFDYEGKQLRNFSVEFEVTKEPEGTRVFYQEPQKVKTGTTTGVVDFRQHGAGNYLAHIAIVDKDKRLDTHIPFSVGIEDADQKSFSPLLATTLGLLLAVYAMIRFVLMKEKSREIPKA